VGPHRRRHHRALPSGRRRAPDVFRAPLTGALSSHLTAPGPAGGRSRGPTSTR
jgi:hypothetical protein